MEQIKRAAGYIRVSTAEQATRGLSVETQIAEIENYAKLHNMKLEEVYIDRGITARKSLEKRVDFMRMMKDVESGRINHIIVLRLDRFFRNVYDYHNMMRNYLEPNKCDWSAVKEQYTTASTNGRLMINLRLSIAEQECDTDSDRIKDVLAHRARQGFAISGSQPFGYKIVDHRVVPDEETAPIVRDLFEQMELLNSARMAMRYVNNKYGTTIAYARAVKMLRHRMYTGRYQDIENYCTPIVTKKQFENVQRLLSMNARVRKNKITYIFSGLVFCNECGKRMVGRYCKPRQICYYYYRCNSAILDGVCENKIAINTEIIEDYLYKNVERLIRERIMATESESNKAKVQKSNRKEIEKKLRRLNDLYVNGFIEMDKYKADYEDLQSQIIDSDPKEQKKDFAELKKFLQSNFQECYPTLSDIEKQAMWRTIIREIRVSGTEVLDVKFLL